VAGLSNAREDSPLGAGVPPGRGEGRRPTLLRGGAPRKRGPRGKTCGRGRRWRGPAGGGGQAPSKLAGAGLFARARCRGCRMPVRGLAGGPGVSETGRRECCGVLGWRRYSGSEGEWRGSSREQVAPATCEGGAPAAVAGWRMEDAGVVSGGRCGWRGPCWRGLREGGAVEDTEPLPVRCQESALSASQGYLEVRTWRRGYGEADARADSATET
jgi:hypothetical protein